MTSRARSRTALLAATLLLAACSGEGDPSATSSPGGTSSGAPSSTSTAGVAACDRVVDRVVDATQRHVDQYGTAVAAGGDDAGGAPAGGLPDLQQVLEQARARLDGLGCDQRRTSEQLAAGLDGLDASGPLAEAVKGQLVASMTGRVSSVVETRKVGTGEDLRDVLPELAPGSTVRLAAGEHRLRDSIVLLQGVRLVGAGRDRTTLTSSAPDAAMLALAQDRVDLRGLTLRHVGDAPASLVVAGSSTSLVLDRVGVVGGRGAAGGSGAASRARGGSGVLMAAGRRATGERGTTLEVTDSVFRGNDSAGILLSGGHVASVVGSTFLDSGQCGICFVGTSSGLVRDSRFRGGVTGLIAADRAAPLVTGSAVLGAEIGVQAVDRASPVIRRTTVADARRAALLFGDRSRGRVESVTCRGSRFDIVIEPDAVPFIGDNGCSVQPTG